MENMESLRMSSLILTTTDIEDLREKLRYILPEVIASTYRRVPGVRDRLSEVYDFVWVSDNPNVDQGLAKLMLLVMNHFNPTSSYPSDKLEEHILSLYNSNDEFYIGDDLDPEELYQFLFYVIDSQVLFDALYALTLTNTEYISFANLVFTLIAYFNPKEADKLSKVFIQHFKKAPFSS